MTTYDADDTIDLDLEPLAAGPVTPAELAAMREQLQAMYTRLAHCDRLPGDAHSDALDARGHVLRAMALLACAAAGCR